MKADVVITAAKKFDWPSIREYVVSLAMTGFKGRKIMFVDGVTDWSRRKLLEYGWELVDFSAVEPVCGNRMPGWLFSVARWRPVVEFLRGHKDEFRYVVWTDIGDVIFQTDPAKWLEENIGIYELVGATESTRNMDSPFNKEWLLSTVPDYYDAMKEVETCCAGTVAGTVEAFHRVAEQVVEILSRAGNVGVDQAALNYALFSQPSGSVWVPTLDKGFTCTCSWVIGLERYGQPQLSTVEGTVLPIVDRGNGRIWTGDKSPKLFSIVHQYNRDPELTASINKRYKGPDPRVLIAIKSATEQEAEAVRNSWLRYIKQFPNVHYKFFRDAERHAELLYSIENGYDFTFVVCSDTIVDIERLMSSGFDRHHYFGRRATYLYGPCCWISRDAAKIAVAEPDLSVQDALTKHNLTLVFDDRHAIRQLPRRTNDIISTFVFDTETRENEKWESALIEKRWSESRRAMKPPVTPRSSMRGMRTPVQQPKALIVISSCEQFELNGNNQAVRDTWLKGIKSIPNLDYVFLTGGTALSKDELHLNVQDDYAHVTWKTVAGHEWAIKQGYDFIFQTFPDVYIRPERLIAALDTRLDYVGYPLVDGHPYASGGAGYWLSKEASKYLLLEGDPWDWAEDRWVGEIMLKNGFRLYADQRYSPVAYPPLKRNDRITSHLSRGTGNYNKDWMYNTHKFWELSQTV